MRTLIELTKRHPSATDKTFHLTPNWYTSDGNSLLSPQYLAVQLLKAVTFVRGVYRKHVRSVDLLDDWAGIGATLIRFSEGGTGERLAGLWIDVEGG